MEAESKFIETPDIRLHYLEWPGSGPPAVLLHGRGLCAQVWRPTAESLASRFRVVAMDLRGHGDSDKPGGYNWENVAPDLKGFVEGLGLRDILLIGHSRGAVLAALGGSFISDRVRGAILIEPGMPVHNPEAGSHHDRSAAARVARNRRSLWPSRQAIFDRYSQAEAFRNWRTDLLWEYINGGDGGAGRRAGAAEVHAGDRGGVHGGAGPRQPGRLAGQGHVPPPCSSPARTLRAIHRRIHPCGYCRKLRPALSTSL